MVEPVLPSTARTLLARTARVQREGRAPSLVAGVVRDGGLAWSAGRGDVPEPAAAWEDRRGSISKTVTAVAVMRLRDEGRLHLDDPLDRHLTGTPFGDRTVGQLLSHLAGASAESPGGWWERTPGGSLDDLGLHEDHVVLGAARRFHYSNLGFGLLGELVAQARGTSWEEAVTAEVLAPLGMTRTTPRRGQRAAARRRRPRGAPGGRRRPARAGVPRRRHGRRRAALGDAHRPGPVRGLPPRRHGGRPLPGHARGDDGSGRRGLFRARLVRLRPRGAGAAPGRADPRGARGVDARVPGRCLRRPGRADRCVVPDQHDLRAGPARLRAARGPAGRRAAD